MYVWVHSDDASSVPTARRPAPRRAPTVARAMARARAAPTSRLATPRARLATARPRARVARRAATPDDDATHCRRLLVRELRERLIASGAHDAAIVRRTNKAELVEMCEALVRRERARERGAASGGGGTREDGGETAEAGDEDGEATATGDAIRAHGGGYQRTMFNGKVVDAVSGGSTALEEDMKSNFSGAELTFLGTSSGAPSFTRNVSSVALRLENEVWLFDCGEATQHQLMRSKLKYAKITRIFITHMHGDHIFGLPGLICAISGARTAHSRSYGGSVVPLHIIGPPGIRQFIYSSITWSRSVLGMPLIVTELRQPARASGGSPAAHTSVDPRGKIFMGEYWPDNVSEPLPHFRDAARWNELGMSEQLPIWTAYNDGNFCVRASVLRHPVPCFGYVIDECDASGRLDAEKCVEMGLPPGREYAMLKAGQSVTTKDGRVIRPEDVIGTPRPGRRLVHLGDTCDSSSMVSLAQGADSLIHESTFEAKKVSEALYKGHSTARMAGKFAAQVNARALILTHFSNRYAGGIHRADSNSDDLGASGDDDDDDEDDCEDMSPPDVDSDGEALAEGDRMNVERLVEEAKEAKGDSRVIAASDFFVFNVGRREEFDDFDFSKGDRSVLFASPRKTTPETFVVDQDDGRASSSSGGDDRDRRPRRGGGSADRGGRGRGARAPVSGRYQRSPSSQ